MNNEKNLNTLEGKSLKCPKCGNINIGWQTNCLICSADLMASEVQEESVYKCPSCNAIVEKGQKFCTSCGSKLPENPKVVVEDSENVKKCSNCGAELKQGAKFCTECGGKV